MFNHEQNGLRVDAVQGIRDYFSKHEIARRKMLDAFPRWVMEGKELVEEDKFLPFLEFTSDVLKYDCGEVMDLFLSTYRSMKEGKMDDISIDSFEDLDIMSLLLLKFSFAKITNYSFPIIDNIIDNKIHIQGNVQVQVKKYK